MSTWTDLCWEEPTHFDWILCVVNVWPILISASMFTASAITGSLYMWILWFGLMLDYALNLALRYIIQQPSPNGALAHHAWEMPAAASSALFCLATMMILFILLYNVQQYTLYTACAYGVGVVCLYARMHSGINTPQQTMAGALAGTLEGIIFTLAWHWFGYPYVPFLLSLWPVRAYGITDYFMAGRRLAHYRNTDQIVEMLRTAIRGVDTRTTEALILIAAREIERREPYLSVKR